MRIDHGPQGRVLLLCVWTSLVGLIGTLSATDARAAGWSPPVAISTVLPTGVALAFASDTTGNQVWLTRAPVTGGYVVQASQRSSDGSWTSPAAISTVSTSVVGVTAAVSDSGIAAAAWSTTGTIQIALRSADGLWHPPAALNLTGSILDLQLKLDALGNGAAVWTRLTGSVAVAEVVSFSAGGILSSVTRLSSSSEGAFSPDIAINAAGAAAVVWQSAALLDNSKPYQVKSATRTSAGAWSSPVAISSILAQTWNPQIAIDQAGNLGAIWEQGASTNDYKILVATRPASGAWSAPLKLDTGGTFAGSPDIESDSAGDFTAAWLVAGASGNQVHAATRAAGGNWAGATVLGPCGTTDILLCSAPDVSTSPDGSIAVVGWAAYGSANAPNVAVRLGQGAWTRTILSSGNASQVLTVAWNNANASAFWPESTTGRHKVLVKGSDYR